MLQQINRNRNQNSMKLWKTTCKQWLHRTKRILQVCTCYSISLSFNSRNDIPFFYSWAQTSIYLQTCIKRAIMTFLGFLPHLCFLENDFEYLSLNIFIVKSYQLYDRLLSSSINICIQNIYCMYHYKISYELSSYFFL